MNNISANVAIAIGKTGATTDAASSMARHREKDLSGKVVVITDDSVAVPTTVPARMIVYFAVCENPREYAGRLFWAEREMAAMGIELDRGTAAWHPSSS